MPRRNPAHYLIAPSIAALNGFSRSPKNFRYIVMVLHRVRGQQRDQRTTCRPSQLLASVASSLLPNLCYLLPSPRRFKHR